MNEKNEVTEVTTIIGNNDEEIELPFSVYVHKGNSLDVTLTEIVVELIKGFLERTKQDHESKQST